MEEKTLQQLYREAADRMEKAGVPDPRYDARALLLSSYGLTSAQYLLYAQVPPSSLIPRILPDPAALQASAQRFSEYTGRRCRREPLQQILGTVGFYGLEFRVTQDVLCPRADTETLVDAVLERVKSGGALLDICTGSGCIALSLARYGGFRTVTAVDISEAALRVAKENAVRILGDEAFPKRADQKSRTGNGGDPAADALEITGRGTVQTDIRRGGFCFRLLQSDMFSALAEQRDADGAMQKYDCIVSNPPYIPSDVVEQLEPEVRAYEPRIALDGAADGLFFYRILASECPRYLRPGGRVFFEIGYDQGESVPALLRAEGFREISVIRDLGGQDRVVAGRL